MWHARTHDASSGVCDQPEAPKRIEEGFGWLKTVGGLHKTKLIGRAKLSAQLLLGFSVYNLIRLESE